MDKTPGQQRLFVESPMEQPEAVGMSPTVPVDHGGDTDSAVELTVDSVERLRDLYAVTVVATNKLTAPNVNRGAKSSEPLEVAIMDATMRLSDLTPQVQPVDDMRRGEHRVRTLLAIAVVLPFSAMIVTTVARALDGAVSVKVLGAVLSIAATAVGLIVRYYFGPKKDGKR